VPVLASRGVRFGEAESGQVGHGAQAGGGGVLRWHPEDQVLWAEAGIGGVVADFARQLRAELEEAVFPVLGVFLDQEPPALRVELRINLHYGAADGQHAGNSVDILSA
jgi:hypothetical protein